MTEGEKTPGDNMPEYELKDVGREIDVTDLLLESTPAEFAEKIAGYSDSDRLVLNLKLAEAHPDFIRRFITNRSKSLVRIHCTLDEFNEYSNSGQYPQKSANIEWVCD